MAGDERLRQREGNGSTSTNACSSVNRHVPHIDARFGARIRGLRKGRQWTQWPPISALTGATSVTWSDAASP
jgi:hypothetical protein